MFDEFEFIQDTQNGFILLQLVKFRTLLFSLVELAL